MNGMFMYIYRKLLLANYHSLREISNKTTKQIMDETPVSRNCAIAVAEYFGNDSTPSDAISSVDTVD